MAVFWLPFTVNEQIITMKNLLQISFLGYDEKKELLRILDTIEYNKTLNSSEKIFLENLISRYGVFL